MHQQNIKKTMLTPRSCLASLNELKLLRDLREVLLQKTQVRNMFVLYLLRCSV